MNAVLKQKPTGRTVASLEAEVAALEHNLLFAQRDQNKVRAGLQVLIAEGDEQRIALARNELDALEVMIKHTNGKLAQTREAVLIAKERDRRETNERSYDHLKKLAADLRKKVEALGDATKAFAIAYKDVFAAQDLLDAQMTIAGVPLDHYIQRGKIKGTVKMALHLETAGEFGEVLNLDSPEQLRRSGRASLHQLGNEAHVLVMRRIRTSLTVTQE